MEYFTKLRVEHMLSISYPLSRKTSKYNELMALKVIICELWPSRSDWHHKLAPVSPLVCMQKTWHRKIGGKIHTSPANYQQHLAGRVE